ncbi:hypothetical protein [Caulobacter sp. S45]|uniref:hypothetical protein n=1 Tax=Caulobacter sp. S45 TaxID=1641861 RepID=UPI00157539F4|nr:hypothetical protein [Caulobacter sp. S45]
MAAFETPVHEVDGVLAGPLRMPRQMLAVQEYDGHASIHDDETARKLGFKGGTIEGPTHFSQFAPLGSAVWGEAWFAHGCLSAHYRNAAFEGEEVRAFLRRPAAGERQAEVWMLRADGTEILGGTASLGPHFAPTALDRRLAELTPLADPVVLADVKVGLTSQRVPVRMDADQHMGALYPFSLAQKLERITEPSPWYSGDASPWGRAIVPMEMISVLMQYTARDGVFPVRGPAVGLFADQEIRLLDGPVFVGEAYEVRREVVAMSGSRRTESLWVRSTLYAAQTDRKVATMLLNLATLKESYAPYAAERAALYG